MPHRSVTGKKNSRTPSLANSLRLQVLVSTTLLGFMLVLLLSWILKVFYGRRKDFGFKNRRVRITLMSSIGLLLFILSRIMATWIEFYDMWDTSRMIGRVVLAFYGLLAYVGLLLSSTGMTLRLWLLFYEVTLAVAEGDTAWIKLVTAPIHLQRSPFDRALRVVMNTRSRGKLVELPSPTAESSARFEFSSLGSRPPLTSALSEPPFTDADRKSHFGSRPSITPTVNLDRDPLPALAVRTSQKHDLKVIRIQSVPTMGLNLVGASSSHQSPTPSTPQLRTFCSNTDTDDTPIKGGKASRVIEVGVISEGIEHPSIRIENSIELVHMTSSDFTELNPTLLGGLTTTASHSPMNSVTAEPSPERASTVRSMAVQKSLSSTQVDSMGIGTTKQPDFTDVSNEQNSKDPTQGSSQEELKLKNESNSALQRAKADEGIIVMTAPLANEEDSKTRQVTRSSSTFTQNMNATLNQFSWYYRNKGSYGNPSYLLIRLMTACVMILIVCMVVIITRLPNMFVDGIFAIWDAALFAVVLYIAKNYPSFHDALFVYKEFQLTTYVIIPTIVGYAAVFIFREWFVKKKSWMFWVRFAEQLQMIFIAALFFSVNTVYVLYMFRSTDHTRKKNHKQPPGWANRSKGRRRMIDISPDTMGRVKKMHRGGSGTDSEIGGAQLRPVRLKRKHQHSHGGLRRRNSNALLKLAFHQHSDHDNKGEEQQSAKHKDSDVRMDDEEELDPTVQTALLDAGVVVESATDDHRPLSPPSLQPLRLADRGGSEASFLTNNLDRKQSTDRLNGSLTPSGAGMIVKPSFGDSLTVLTPQGSDHSRERNPSVIKRLASFMTQVGNLSAPLDHHNHHQTANEPAPEMSDMDVLIAVINDENGFRAFMKHLFLEFAYESMVCIFEMLQFRGSFHRKIPEHEESPALTQTDNDGDDPSANKGSMKEVKKSEEKDEDPANPATLSIDQLRMIDDEEVLKCDEFFDRITFPMEIREQVKSSIVYHKSYSFEQKAVFLIDKYLSDTAELSVNVGYRTRRKLLELAEVIIAEHESWLKTLKPKQTVVRRNVMDNVLTELLVLLKDSMARFKETPEYVTIFHEIFEEE